MQSELEEIGLTAVEAKVYLTLVKKGPSLAGLITKETGTHRRTTYDILYRLRSKGLISNIIIENKRYFEAVNPDRLLELLKEKEDILKNILPDLKNFYKSNKSKNEVLFFRGKQALKTVFDDLIREGKEIIFIGKFIEINELLNIYTSRFDAKRIEKKIYIKMLFDLESRKFILNKRIPLSEIKYLSSVINSNMSIYVYGNNISLIVWKDEPISIIIREKDMTDGFRSYFNIMWNISRK
ncbi:hypothetical protein HYU23_02000 [Candidatus Woesearchaeota archaeon]|nr:hypothetical protein [Candidatus Woesearchaeota archaeon]